MFFLHLIFFFFYLVIFSSAQSITDYDGETEEQSPKICIFKAYAKVKGIDLYDPKPLTDENLFVAIQTIKTCMTEIAKINPKVKANERSLAKILYSWFEFFNTRSMIKCGKEMRMYLEENQCDRYSGSASDCNRVWGRNGCLIKLYKERCGSEIARQIRDMAVFMNAKEKGCVDKYLL